jgi:hypothetical protein
VAFVNFFYMRFLLVILCQVYARKRIISFLFFCKRNSLVIKSRLDWVYVYEFMSSQEGSSSFLFLWQVVIET